jgi:hypothetical protein
MRNTLDAPYAHYPLVNISKVQVLTMDSSPIPPYYPNLSYPIMKKAEKRGVNHCFLLSLSSRCITKIESKPGLH